MAINYGKLIKTYEQLGPDQATGVLRESFAAKEVRPQDFDMGKLFTECFGWNNFQSCRAKDSLAVNVMEAAGSVATNAFQNISGQIVYSTILEAYQAQDFVFTKLIPEQQTPFSGEKIAGISEIGDKAGVVNETDPYPLAGVSENWIQTPETKKRGFIVPVTREAIFFDRTGVLLQRCADVGKWMGVNREKRAIDCVIDENTTDHRYNWKGTTYASYQTTTPWDNVTASAALVDWTDLDEAEQTLNALTDPFTGEPILIDAKHLVCVRALQRTAERILTATEVRMTVPGYATTANPNQYVMANPYANKYQIVTSLLLAARLATDTTWFLGDISKYAKYMVNWPMSVKQAPPNSHDEFHRDIVQQYRADERGAYAVVEPRAITTCTA